MIEKCVIYNPPVSGSDITLQRLNKSWDQFVQVATEDELQIVYRLVALGIPPEDNTALKITQYAYDLVATYGSLDTKLILTTNVGAIKSYRVLASFNDIRIQEALLKNNNTDGESLTIIYNNLLESMNTSQENFKLLRNHINCPISIKEELDELLSDKKFDKTI